MKERLQGWKMKVGAGLTAAGVSMSSFAADHSATITAAGADGETNTTAAVVAILGIVAVITGVTYVIKFLSR